MAVSHDESEGLADIAAAVVVLGDRIETHRQRAETLLIGKIGISTLGRLFKVVRVVSRFGGMSCKLWATGPILKQGGQPHARIEDSCPIEIFSEPPSPDPNSKPQGEG